MMALTERQKKELNEAILEYLVSEGEPFSKTAAAFKEEGGLEASAVVGGGGGRGLLEKKWVSVVRLQKKVLELEAQLAAAKESSSLRPGSGLHEGGDASVEGFRGLPKAPAKHILSGHRGAVNAVAVHPVYSLVASGSEDGTVKIWDYESGQYERTLKGHTQSVSGVAFDSSGKLLVSCSLDLSAKIWDLSTYTCMRTLRGHDHTISAVAFLAGNDTVVTCSRDNTVKCWEVSTGYCTRTLSGHSDWVRCISISPDGGLLASAGSDQTVIIWKLSTGQPLQTLRGHEHVIECVSFGKKSVVAQLLDAKSSGDSATDGASAGENLYLASGSRDKTVKLWDAVGGVCLMTFTDHENWVRSLLVHPSGKYIVSCSDDKSIRVFDVKDQRCMRTIPDAHGHFVASVATNPKCSVFVTGSVDKNVCIWHCN